MLIAVLPWAISMEVRSIGVSVVDNDLSPESRSLTEKVEFSPYFIYKGSEASYGDALKKVEDGSSDIILEIPSGYGKALRLGEKPQVMIDANSVNGNKGTLGAAYLNSIVSSAGAPVTGEKISEVFLYNPRNNYKMFMIPAMMAMVMVILCGVLPALNIVSEKESGTIEQINVTPVKKWQFILAKMLPYWIIGLLVFTLCLLLARLLYGMKPVGSIALLYLLAALVALVFSGMGLIVSNYSQNIVQAMFVIWFILVCMLLLSGLFTPVESMPGWARTLTGFIPMKYFMESMRGVYLRGASVGAIAKDLAALLGFALAFSAWAVASYRKRS